MPIPFPYTLYNEIDPFACNWLRNLIKHKHLPPGIVNPTPIQDLNHVTSKTAHCFCGIGGWPLALKLAGWPPSRPVWTGSCPCQPFSVAGKQLGTEDPRHLWPAFFNLITKSKPDTIFGEQVAGKAGRLWLSGIRLDLESLGYAFGAADLTAAGVGAPHIRQRLYWVASKTWNPANPKPIPLDPARMADVPLPRLEGRRSEPPRRSSIGGQTTRLEYPAGDGRLQRGAKSSWRGAVPRCGQDGKWRAVEPGIFPLSHGVSNRVGKLRGAGNAIIVPLAVEFVKAFLDTEKD